MECNLAKHKDEEWNTLNKTSQLSDTMDRMVMDKAMDFFNE